MHIIRGLCFGYAAMLSIGSLIDIKKAPRLDFVFEDKVIHFVAYFVLCPVFYLMLKTYQIRHSLNYAIILSLVFGTILEFLQQTLTDNRTFDLYDLIANSLGVITAAGIVVKNKKFIVKKLETFM